MHSIAKWLFFDSIYGIILIAAAVYGVFWALKRIVPVIPDPIIVAGIAGLVGLFTLPSIPRYQFEDEVASQIDSAPWIRVINQTKWGDITEPLTLIVTPIGSFTLAMPNDQITGGFKEVVMRYDEEPSVSLIDADCDGLNIYRAEPDADGTFRYTTETAQEMTKLERETYCEYEWTLEKEALRTEILRSKGKYPAKRH